MRRGRVIRNPATGLPFRTVALTAVPDTVYFARCGDYIKVGASCDVKRRLQVLNCPSGRANIHCPPDLPREPLVLIATMPGDYGREAAAHIALRDFNVVGEWFRADPAVLAWITERTERAA